MRKKKEVFFSITLFLLLIIGLSYAYFVSRTTGSEETSTMISNAKNLELTYADGGTTISASNIVPGWSASKTFTVTNTGNAEAKYALIFLNINNTFSNGSIGYSISSPTGINIELTDLPNNQSIIPKATTINPGVTHTYTITTYFNNLNRDQSSDLNKTFSYTIGITGIKNNNATLLSRLEIGDFVEYDAGTWTQEEINSIKVGPKSSLVSATNSTSVPSYYYQFGGFVTGQSRNIGAPECLDHGNYYYAKMYDNNNSSNKVPIAGWRIFNIDQENEIITIISAANPEDYYIPISDHVPGDQYITEYILSGEINDDWPEKDIAESKYTIRDWSMYENKSVGAYDAKPIKYYDLHNWFNKYITTVNGNDLFSSSSIKKIYNNPYLKYQNLIDNHTFYILSPHKNQQYNSEFASDARQLYSVNQGNVGVRLLIKLPLSSFQNGNPTSTRTVTLDGMVWSGGTYGSETTQTYNVWNLRKPEVGDFVEYDAGTWTQAEIDSIKVGLTSSLTSANNSTSAPTDNFQFGGFVAGQSRNIGVTSYMDGSGWSYTRREYAIEYAKVYEDENSNNLVPISGWRIFDMDDNTGTITLVSAANPEGYYMEYNGYASTYILTGKTFSDRYYGSSSSYTRRNWHMYENAEYDATNARPLTEDDLNGWYSKYIIPDEEVELWQDEQFQKIYSQPFIRYQSLIDNYAEYWTCNAVIGSSLRTVKSSIQSSRSNSDEAVGIRILVTIPKSKISKNIMPKQKTVTLSGLIYGYSERMYGPETTIDYNVWALE